MYLLINTFSILLPPLLSLVHDQEAAINDKMQRMEVNHANRFTLIREAFNVPIMDHEVVSRETKDKILRMAQNFNAEVTVKGNCIYIYVYIISSMSSL